METPTLIYCANGNARFADIAIQAGFKFGARLPSTVYRPVYFADQNWKKPDRARYMVELAKHHPTMATVLDLECEEQIFEVLDWAVEASQYVARVVIVPKVHGVVGRLPVRVGNAEVILGYSVPTKYGGTEVATWEFAGWPVHLLGGSPHAQMRLAYYMRVVSADGNYINLMATRYCQFWASGNARYAKNRFWPTLKAANGGVLLDAADLPYIAFERSCENIVKAWRDLS